MIADFVIPYMKQHSLHFLYWDNATVHGTHHNPEVIQSHPVVSLLAMEDIQQVVACANSPDLNPIERCFATSVAVMKQHCGKSNLILNTDQLRTMAHCTFLEAAKTHGDTYIEALPSQWAKVIAQGGRNTYRD